MKFFAIIAIALALFAAVLAVPQQKLVGAKKCTYGPSYWCASRENAEECNALQHCETKVWNKN